MARNTIHLISNSHLDPAWLWEWPEGLAEALALARTVVDLCARERTFVFNRNEALYYRWIEEYDPPLFKRIKRLVKTGQWHIMGGWYLQPDCNMPSGESFVRQILIGKRYFQEKFGVDVTTAANLDPFGHTRGLVQILARSGYDAYLFCRPGTDDCPLPAPEFTWVGYDGSTITATLAEAHYNSPPGGARQKVEAWLNAHPDKPCSALLWGVGNHGGGPSWDDLRQLRRLIRATRSCEIRHSTPAAYFADLRRRGELPRHAGDLNPWAVGCYTSMARIKQKHRRLEHELFATEKMLAAAAAQQLLPYPQAQLREAACDLLSSEFHDALPGSSIPPVEEAVLQGLDHGLEIVARLKTRAFFALSAGQRRVRQDEIPLLVYNPHPFRVTALVECEAQPAVHHELGKYGLPLVSCTGKLLPAQAEQEHANINEDHRKRVVFEAVLEPSRMNRFDCRIEKLARRPRPSLPQRGGKLRFKTADLAVLINTRTGLIDRYRVRGVDYLGANAGRPIVMADDADPWGMKVRSFRRRAGAFRLMSRAAGTRFSGLSGHPALPSVRVIEDGPVRSVVEAVLAYGDSFICQRYKLPKHGTEIELETRVHWNEKDRLLKLAIPTLLPDAVYRGQVAYGVADLPDNGDEAVAQKWVAVVSRSQDAALTCINDRIYGSDMAGGELRLSLLRGPAHSGHPTGPGRPIVRQDRYTPRIDQGEHVFRFWLNGGPRNERLARVDREALVKNEVPMALSMCPPGGGKLPKAGVQLSDQVVQLAAFKQSEDGRGLIVRLFEPTGRRRTTTVSLPCVGLRKKVTLAPFEIRTLRCDLRKRRFTEVDLLERPLRRKKRG